MQKADIIVVGGGFYGCCIALLMRQYFDDVLIIERENDILKRASSINQARIHTGYHYPRSFVTAYRSFVNFPRFISDFKKTTVSDFTKLYAIAKKGSKVNALRFYDMFRQMNAPISIAPLKFKQFFNSELIEEVFIVNEIAFDAKTLRHILKERIDDRGIKIELDIEVKKVEPGRNDYVRAIVDERQNYYEAQYVFNCTYSQINQLLNNSDIDLLPLKHEITEMPLIELPEEINRLGITVMDGPFFSLMPYPSRGYHSIHHVRYTPHHSWTDLDQFINGYHYLSTNKLESNYLYMIKDAQRYLPVLQDANFIESMYEVKTLLIQNEVDDGRPILLKKDHGIKNFITILGGKIDNVYDVLDMIDNTKELFGLN